MQKKLEKSLDKYYKTNGIYPLNFACKHFGNCKEGQENFVEARMPSLGQKYFDNSTPRIVVISLDPGKENSKPEERIIQKMSRSDKVHQWHKNRHWYLTHEIIEKLIKRFDPHLSLDDTPEHFVHVNSVKCCANLKGNKQAPPHLFKNCRWYIPGEIEILAPDIILTQGDFARNSIWGAFAMSNQTFNKCTDQKHRCWSKVIELNTGHKCLWLHTYHPNQSSGYYSRNKEGYFSCYPEFAWEFMKKDRYS